jgi:hypothetical protein
MIRNRILVMSLFALTLVLIMVSVLFAAEREIKIGVLYPLSGHMDRLEGIIGGVRNWEKKLSIINILRSISR